VNIERCNWPLRIKNVMVRCATSDRLRRLPNGLAYCAEHYACVLRLRRWLRDTGGAIALDATDVVDVVGQSKGGTK
jgi:hypothetical protein